MKKRLINYIINNIRYIIKIEIEKDKQRDLKKKI